MKLKTILLTQENAETALDELMSKKLAERRGVKEWRLTYRGQILGIKIWEGLNDTDKMLLFGMLAGLDTITK